MHDVAMRKIKQHRIYAQPVTFLLLKDLCFSLSFDLCPRASLGFLFPSSILHIVIYTYTYVLAMYCNQQYLISFEITRSVGWSRIAVRFVKAHGFRTWGFLFLYSFFI